MALPTQLIFIHTTNQSHKHPVCRREKEGKNLRVRYKGMSSVTLRINSSGEQTAVRRSPLLEVTPNWVDHKLGCISLSTCLTSSHHIEPGCLASASSAAPAMGMQALSRQLEHKAKPSVLVWGRMKTTNLHFSLNVRHIAAIRTRACLQINLVTRPGQASTMWCSEAKLMCWFSIHSTLRKLALGGATGTSGSL